jgi:hypothetical protein
LIFDMYSLCNPLHEMGILFGDTFFFSKLSTQICTWILHLDFSFLFFQYSSFPFHDFLCFITFSSHDELNIFGENILEPSNAIGFCILDLSFQFGQFNA